MNFFKPKALFLCVKKIKFSCIPPHKPFFKQMNFVGKFSNSSSISKGWKKLFKKPNISTFFLYILTDRIRRIEKNP